jgi:hypothetical protein
MTAAITLQDITIYQVVEQQGPFFDVMEFFPTLTNELLEENRSWLQPTFIDPVSGRLVLCVQSFIIKAPHHNILIDSCVGNHKPRPARPFWNMMNSDRFEKGLAATGLTVNDIDYVMCTHLHVDHVGWNTRLENGRWVPTFPKAKYVMADRELTYWTEKEKDEPTELNKQGRYDRMTDDPFKLAGQEPINTYDFVRLHALNSCGLKSRLDGSTGGPEGGRGKKGGVRLAAYPRAPHIII